MPDRLTDALPIAPEVRLAQLAQTSRQVRTLDRIERLLGAVVTMAGARSATVRCLREPGHRLMLVAAVHVPEDFAIRAADMDASCGTCGDVLRSNRRTVSIVPCECVRSLAGDAAMAQCGSRMLSLPLRNLDEVVGVLSLYLREGELLDPPLAGLLGSLCDLLGSALIGDEEHEHTLVQRLAQERHLLANEVHDALAQNLTSIRMRTALIRDALDRDDTPRVRGYLGEIDAALSVAQSRVRELITHFRTDMDERGLLPALETSITELSSLSGVQIALDNRVSQLDLTVDQEQQVFYIVREALTNAVKHSSASLVEIRLHGDEAGYRFEIEDNGIGLDAEGAGEHGHFGLNIMRERAQGLGGQVEFRSGPLGGTCVCLQFPRVPFLRKAST